MTYLQSLARKSKMPGEEIRKQIPTMMPIIGRYGVKTKNAFPYVKMQKRMVSIYHCIEFMESVKLKYSTRSWSQSWDTESLGFAATTYFPYFYVPRMGGYDAMSQRGLHPGLHSGLGCVACWEWGGLPARNREQSDDAMKQAGFRLYSDEGFLAHLGECQRAKMF